MASRSRVIHVNSFRDTGGAGNDHGDEATHGEDQDDGGGDNHQDGADGDLDWPVATRHGQMCGLTASSSRGSEALWPRNTRGVGTASRVPAASFSFIKTIILKAQP
jgi:hypothetical protein